jgi:hypothetical protein
LGQVIIINAHDRNDLWIEHRGKTLHIKTPAMTVVIAGIGFLAV